jgi:hypothetical protein
MRKSRSRKPTPALVVSTVALVVALGGTSYAAFTLPANSVGSKQLKNSAVTTKKLQDGAVTGAKVNVAHFPTVPSAVNANTAASATSATNASTASNATNLGGRAASTYALAATLQPTSAFMENGWSTASADFGVAGFAKDQFGIVHLFGHAVITAPTTNAIFTLPVGSRPAYQIDVPAAFGAATVGVLRVNPDGTVIPFSAAASFVDLEGITFAAGG